jgi:hypothetical protein
VKIAAFILGGVVAALAYTLISPAMEPRLRGGLAALAGVLVWNLIAAFSEPPPWEKIP